MPILLQARHRLGDIVVHYQAPHDNPNNWSLCIVPASLEARIVTPRENLTSPFVEILPKQFLPMRAWELAPLVGIHRRGDPLPGAFANGRTYLTSPSAQALAVTDHKIHRDTENVRTHLITTLTTPDGLHSTHEIEHRDGTPALIIRTTLRNHGQTPLTLDHTTSFCLSGITPFATEDAPETLTLHRYRSAWSAEARLDSRRLEELHLERSWSGHGIRCERYGQAGSLPLNGYLPFIALEDHAAGAVWAARLAHPGSWQMELVRRGDQLALAGGNADRISGEWSKTLHPGESLTLPEAHITVAAANLETTCARLNTLQRPPLATLPPVERDLPIIFNEWCSSWGAPTHDSMLALADTLTTKATPKAVKYLVIDDGWAERPSRGFQQNGDWIINRAAFPHGLRATADAIRARGLIPGIWFEFEAVNPGSKAWHETAHQLHRDGVPLQVGTRRFWDFRDPWVHTFLKQRVIALLRDNNIGYLKVDHNDTLGPGVDGPEAPGENLRQHLASVQRFFAQLREELPDLVIETCASGGHRLEPSWLAITAMGSFSDAHETPDIPIIAANLLNHILAAQSQIWAVLRSTDTRQRLAYSLAATFLGRMCLSGDIEKIAAENWPLINHALTLYREAIPLIRDGHWSIRRKISSTWQHPRGWQIATAIDTAQKNMLVVWHRFGGEQTPFTHALLAQDTWRIVHEFSERPVLTETRAWTGGVILMEYREREAPASRL